MLPANAKARCSDAYYRRSFRPEQDRDRYIKTQTDRNTDRQTEIQIDR